MEEIIKTNKYLTKVTLDLIDSLPKEVSDLLIDFLNNIEFISRLVSPYRKTAKELPRDTEGKIIVDIVNPHILEDMDYFREAAIYFLKYKVYTRLRPNKNPHSEYGKWIRRERDRIWNGMIRESDGEWITGEMYYYLNYFPIRLNVISKKHKKSVDRIVDFPLVWEGIYLWFHYIYLARYGGLYNDWDGGDHAVLIAKRGASKAHPYDLKVITPEGTKLWEKIKIGSKLYDNNGNETLVTNIPYEGIDSIYRFTLKDGRQVESSKDHLWLVYRRGKLITTDTKSIFKDFRGKRKVSDRNPKGEEFIYLIPKHGSIEYSYTPINIDPYTLGLLIGDGTFRHPNFTNVVYLTSGPEDFEYYKNLIPYNINKLSDGFTYSISLEGVTLYLKDYSLHMTKSEGKFIPEDYKYNSKIVRLLLLKGLLDADGYVDNKGIPTLTTVSERLASDVLELIRSLGYNGKIFKNKAGYKKEGIYIETLPAYTVRIYTDDLIFGLERKNSKIKKRTSKYSRSKLDRTTIVNVEYIGEKNCKCVSVDNKEGLYLIGDYIVTHNSYSGGSILARLFVLGDSKESKENTVGVVTAYDKEKLKKDGILNKFEFGINFIALNMLFPAARLNNSLNEMYWVMGYKDPETDIKKGTLNEVMGVTSKDNADKSRGKRALKFIYEEFGAFPKFIDTWSVNKRSVLEGSYSFGTAIAFGTGGTEGSNFYGALEMIYNPLGYDVYGLPNIYDKGATGNSKSVFFFGAYLNRLGFYNENGVSDVVGALIEILMDRYKVKYNSTDPTLLTRVIAEDPITIQEAIMKRDSNAYPVADLTEVKNLLMFNPKSLDDIYVGKFVMKNGEISYSPDNTLTPIRIFPLKDNKSEGAIEIHLLPFKDSSGKVPWGRYIGGIDTYDDDLSETLSLGSIYILDLYTDQIVFEYTGRPQRAEEFYEICRRALLFYNAEGNYENNKKGLYGYFSKMNSLYLLSDVLDYLKDKDPVKLSYTGNKSKGTTATLPVKNYGRSLLRDFLLKPIPVITTVKVDNEDVEIEDTVFNLTTLKSIALIDELILWNADNNFDRHDAMVMLMLLREERLRRLLGDAPLLLNTDNNYLGNDDFFSKNYDDKRKTFDLYLNWEKLIYGDN